MTKTKYEIGVESALCFFYAFFLRTLSDTFTQQEAPEYFHVDAKIIFFLSSVCIFSVCFTFPSIKRETVSGSDFANCTEVSICEL